jgi:hypothetical protein
MQHTQLQTHTEHRGTYTSLIYWSPRLWLTGCSLRCWSCRHTFKILTQAWTLNRNRKCKTVQTLYFKRLSNDSNRQRHCDASTWSIATMPPIRPNDVLYRFTLKGCINPVPLPLPPLPAPCDRLLWLSPEHLWKCRSHPRSVQPLVTLHPTCTKRRSDLQARITTLERVE